MTRNSWGIAGVAAGVAAVLLGGGWFLLGGRDTVQAGTEPEMAATTTLSWPADPSDGSQPRDPYPTVPSAQVRDEQLAGWGVRTAADGRRLFVQLSDSACASEEARLLGEHPDRVDVEIHMVAKPLPPDVSVSPDGSYGCVGMSGSDGPYAVIDLSEPLGEREVVVRRVY